MPRRIGQLLVGVVGLAQRVDERRRAPPACRSSAIRRAMNGSRCGTFAFAASASARAGVRLGQRLGGVPVHQRQVVVGRRPRRGRAGLRAIVPALVQRQPLQRRRRGTAARPATGPARPARRTASSSAGDDLPLLARRAGSPRRGRTALVSSSAFGIALVRQPAGDVQRPQAAQPRASRRLCSKAIFGQRVVRRRVRACRAAARSCRIRRAWRTYQSFSCSCSSTSSSSVSFARSTPAPASRRRS